MVIARLPHRPNVQLLLPREVRVGGDIDAEIVIEARRELSVGPIRIDIEGRAGTTTFLRLQASPYVGGTVPAGSMRLRCRATLPPEVPPTYDGRLFAVRYTARVHVDIPWWPDRQAVFALNVRPRERSLPEEAPFHFSTRPAGPVRGRPHLEGAVDRRVLALGDTIAGRVSLSNLASVRYSRLELWLISTESRGPMLAPTEAARFTLRLSMPSADGEPVAFQMRVPDDVTPSFQTSVGALSWRLMLAARYAGGTLEVPIPIELRAASREAIAQRLVPALPAIGNARVVRMWSEVAPRFGFALDGARLVARVGAVEVEVEREDRGRAGALLVARLRWPTLGLDLAGGPRGALARVWTQLRFEGEALAGSFLAEHELGARSPGQARAVARWLFPGPMGDLRVASLADQGALLEWRGGTDDPTSLGELLRALQELVQRVGTLRAQISPPDLVAPYALLWRAWAEAGDRSLDTTTLSASGWVEGIRVDLQHRWDGPQLVGAALVVYPESALDEVPVIRDGVELDGVAGLTPESRALFTSLLEVGDVVVESDRLEVRMGHPLENPVAIEPVLHRMSKLAALLRRGAGPYR